MLFMDLRTKRDFRSSPSCEIYHREQHIGDHVHVKYVWPTGSYLVSVMIITRDLGEHNAFLETSRGLIFQAVNGDPSTFKRIGFFSGLKSLYMFRYTITATVQLV
jgi:hypothetical protein